MGNKLIPLWRSITTLILIAVIILLMFIFGEKEDIVFVCVISSPVFIHVIYYITKYYILKHKK
jgi:hypothetical protein